MKDLGPEFADALVGKGSTTQDSDELLREENLKVILDKHGIPYDDCTTYDQLLERTKQVYEQEVAGPELEAFKGICITI